MGLICGFIDILHKKTDIQGMFTLYIGLKIRAIRRVRHLLASEDALS